MSYSKRRRLNKSSRRLDTSDADLEQLREFVYVCCQTIFVGAVSKIEKHFGELWDDEKDLDEDEMTEEQKKWFYQFLDAREEIFDQGNSELTKIIHAMGHYDVARRKLEMRFYSKENK